MNVEDKKFFSFATVAPIGEPAYTASKQFLEDFYSIGPPEVIYKYEAAETGLAKEAALLLNCDQEEITFIKNTTEGINIASEALPIKEGDEVLILANEYPANLLPWLKKKKDNIAVTVVGENYNEKAFQTLIYLINSNTKVISISSAQYYDGYIMDIELLSKICREKGIYLVIDAVQSIGVRKIDLSKTPVDILVCGGQKYLQAGMGNGFMYVNKNIMPKLKDYKVGLRSMKSFNQESYALKDTADRFLDGTQNESGIVALHAALMHVNSIGIDNIEKKNIELLTDIRSCLSSYNIPYIDHGDHQSNIVSMQVKDPKALFEYLKEQSIYIKPIKDVARLSFMHYSKIEEVEALAKLTRQWLDSNEKAD